MRYSKEYVNVFAHPETASTILLLNKSKRRLVMSALANLAKYLGVYEYWKGIVRNAGLQWEKRSGLETIVSILNTDIEDVKKWLLDVVSILPKDCSTVVVFEALTGLRPSEACNSCRLITELSEVHELHNYLDEDLMMLQHFKFPKLFLRKSKNAYISFVTEELVDLVLCYKPLVNHDTLKSRLRKRGFKIHLRDLRKLHATMLREYVNREIIDLLHGRVGESIFLRFYYKPLLTQIRTKTIKGIQALQNELLSIL